jgi:hypothetical protein
MHAIRKAGLFTALRVMQTAEFVLDGLIQTRAYIPFATISLLVGFAIGYLITRF